MSLYEIIDPNKWQTVQRNVKLMLERRAELELKIKALELDGCIHGNIVEEWRGERGPYYRLTFYTNPNTGFKEKPVYLGNRPEPLERAKRHIANHAEREDLRADLAKVNEALKKVSRSVEYMEHYTTVFAGQVDRLVLPGFGAQLAGVTN